ncbi:cytochrome c/c1 heme-lyase [Blastocladiella britannica]|nr:cytochrome c/c1 heme-lyase [Blastocladiella britannica]
MESRCPVDHANMDPAMHPFAMPAGHPVVDSGSASADGSNGAASKCPVDHSKMDMKSHPMLAAAAPTAPADAHDAHDSALNPDNYLPSNLAQQPRHPDQVRELPTDREHSTILRGGEDASEGERWVYPSQQMFFNAMKRKNWTPREEDMAVVVPIHNAVNEMAWKKILEWEALAEETKCTPKLTRFQGRPTDLTPRAWFKSLFLGYSKPFDRHDWSVDRCGTQVNYVIDFYSGKLPAGRQGQGVVSFFLDVRPKLDTWEGVRLRVHRFWGDLLA